ncbi:hypothetical protein OIE66_19495 [Nonomuraea sp. NBC_01738]|uniref:hypothetical protein n=1 Tax=Nonomuraea sp. NBC_01738 TaxID=2976003 RepID=UPI002E0DF99D|nr:hypothetical protein OIE66_19495 [Nonomuraea sp. NBC_01738]
MAFGALPALLQSALIEVTGAANADVATSLQTTVYNAGIAAGSLAGGLVLQSAGAGALPWAALPLLAGALLVAAKSRSKSKAGAGGGRELGEITGEHGERPPMPAGRAGRTLPR